MVRTDFCLSLKDENNKKIHETSEQKLFIKFSRFGSDFLETKYPDMELDLLETKDELPSSNKCRCCLQDGELKELWSEYCDDDGVVIYGEALVECYSLALHQPAEVVEKICTACIRRLQDAVMFKKLVLESDNKLLKHYFQGEEVRIDDDEELSQDGEQLCSDENDDYLENEVLDDDNSNENERTEIEYLESESLEATGSNEQTKRKVPRTTRKKNLNLYKQYTPEDLEECLVAVNSNAMTRSEAASFYNVPIQTLRAKLKGELMPKEVPAVEKNDSREKYKSFLQEIKTVLKYTNGTPFQSKTGRYYCVYCRKCIDDPNELRSHTRTEHSGERLSGVDIFMKANWINETMRLDIVDFQCTVCAAPIDSWNNMFHHLKESHNVELDDAYTKIIPYKLTGRLLCALCADRCDSFNILDAHMNSHYTSYICGECGDSFLAETRLKKHLETHSTDKFKCPFCPKIFTLEKYRKKHIEGVHDQGLMFRCRYCKEGFFNEYRRHQHMLKNHMEKIQTIPCEHCDKTFTYRPYYMKHMRLMHTMKDIKRHKCPQCDKMFKMRYELKKHEEWHMGYNKQTCLVCEKTFSSKQYLEKHYNKVHSDNEVLVLETDQS